MVAWSQFLLPYWMKGRNIKRIMSHPTGGGARGKKDGRAGGYVESWQGVRKRGEGRGIGLKSRINLKIGSKNGLPGRWGLGPVEAR